MENYDIMAGVLFLVWTVNMVLPFILGVITGLVYFWSRGKVNLELASRYQAFKWREKKEEWLDSIPACWFVQFTVIEGLVGLLVMILLAKAGLIVAVIAGTLLALLYLPRFIIDLTKGLKMNHKSGDLEEINSLKKRLEQLEKGE